MHHNAGPEPLHGTLSAAGPSALRTCTCTPQPHNTLRLTEAGEGLKGSFTLPTSEYTLEFSLGSYGSVQPVPLFLPYSTLGMNKYLDCDPTGLHPVSKSHCQSASCLEKLPASKGVQPLLRHIIQALKTNSRNKTGGHMSTAALRHPRYQLPPAIVIADIFPGWVQPLCPGLHLLYHSLTHSWRRQEATSRHSCRRCR